MAPLSDSDQPDQPLSSEQIADAADTDDGDDFLSNILKASLDDKLPDPIAEHMESPPPPKLEPNIITPPSSVGSNHGKVMDFGGPPSYKPPETPPLSNKMPKQESSPVATTKSPVNSNSTKGSGRPSTGKSPRRGRPPKNKPKEDSSAQISKPAISAKKDTANANKKSVSRQKSTTKSKVASEADKMKTLTSTGNKRGRPPKSRQFVSSSEESSSSESSDSSSENSSDEDDELEWKPTFKSSPSSAKSPKDSKNTSVSKRTPPDRALTARKTNPTSGPFKHVKNSPCVNPNVDSEIDLEEVFNATKFSPYPDITALEPILSPLPNRDVTTAISRTTQMPKAATSPTKSSSMSSIPTSKSSSAEFARKISQSGLGENKLGVTYVDGRPCVMVCIDLSKLDKWPSRTRESSGSDVDVDERVSAFIEDGKSLLEIKQMPSIVEPLPPSPAPRVHSDSISTNSEFSDGEIKDSDDDKSDNESENEISDSNNNKKDNVSKDNKNDSSSGSSSEESSSDDDDDDEGEDKKSVSESVSSETKKEEIDSREQAAADNTEGAAASPAPKTKKLTASGQKEVLNRIFNTNEKLSLSSVKIPKKRPQSPNHGEDRKRARTDHNRHSDYSHRE